MGPKAKAGIIRHAKDTAAIFTSALTAQLEMTCVCLSRDRIRNRDRDREGAGTGTESEAGTALGRIWS